MKMFSRPSVSLAVLLALPLVASASEIVEKTFGDWSYTSLSFGQTASTQSAQGTKGMSLGAGCEEGVFTITVMNLALIMTGQQGYKTEVSYDGQTWETVENDALPVEHLPKLLSPPEPKLYVRWHIKEGMVAESFSLDGAPEAIRLVATACNVTLP